MHIIGLNYFEFLMKILIQQISLNLWTYHEIYLIQLKFIAFSTRFTSSSGSERTQIHIIFTNSLELKAKLNLTQTIGQKKDFSLEKKTNKKLGFKISIKLFKHADSHKRFTQNSLFCLKKIFRNQKCKLIFTFSVLKDLMLEDKTKGIDINDVTKLVNSTVVRPDMPY